MNKNKKQACILVSESRSFYHQYVTLKLHANSSTLQYARNVFNKGTYFLTKRANSRIWDVNDGCNYAYNHQ